ncbi:MAG: VWA domain-containing protein [Nanoarchaeota archaeon]|nr:VWA domain-containing protein [Nanoarchaeota archaeon]
MKKKVFRCLATKFPESYQGEEEPTSSDDDTLDSSSSPQVEKTSRGDELDGNLASDPEKDRLAHTILEVDKQQIEDGMLVDEAFNQNLKSFLPDMMFKDLVTDYKNAEKLYGQTLIRELTGYDPRFIDKNKKIPEFQRELKKRIDDKMNELKEHGIIGSRGGFSPDAINAAALFLIDEEFKENKHNTSQFGEQVHKASKQQGEKSTIRPYSRQDSYRDIALKHSISKSIRRGHETIEADDLLSYDREARQQVNIIYALDTSGSMKGEKLRLAKRAGVALAHRAIRDQNKVGLVLFGSNIEKTVPLTKDFFTFVRPLTTSSPGQETNIALAISQAAKLLQDAKGIRHIVVLTDGLHTTDHHSSVLERVAIATQEDISISLVGIGLDEQGHKLATRIVDISGGRLFEVSAADEVGGVVIADYVGLR